MNWSKVAAAIGLGLTQGPSVPWRYSRAHAIALDVVLTIPRGNVLGQHLQRALGSSIGRNGLPAQLAHHRADVDDLACTLFDHIRQHCLGAS